MRERPESLSHLTILIFFTLDFYWDKKNYQKVGSKVTLKF